MYRGFNLKLPEISFDEPYLSKVKNLGAEINREHQQKVKTALDEFVTEDGDLDASKMRANWFPQIESDIFISHSHQDEQRAILLSGWLKDVFGLTAFIDSCAWGHSRKLLKLIDSQYCYDDESELYSYEKRNLSTSHVYMMLSTSLSKMIDHCECLFFMNTPRSLTPRDTVEGNNGTTLSPWIYSEIAMTSLIRRRTPEQHRHKGLVKKSMAKAELMEGLKVLYDLNLDHLTELNLDDLNAWRKKLDEESHALDVLYAMKED